MKATEAEIVATIRSLPRRYEWEASRCSYNYGIGDTIRVRFRVDPVPLDFNPDANPIEMITEEVETVVITPELYALAWGRS